MISRHDSNVLASSVSQVCRKLKFVVVLYSIDYLVRKLFSLDEPDPLVSLRRGDVRISRLYLCSVNSLAVVDLLNSTVIQQILKPLLELRLISLRGVPIYLRRRHYPYSSVLLEELVNFCRCLAEELVFH